MCIKHFSFLSRLTISIYYVLSNIDCTPNENQQSCRSLFSLWWSVMWLVATQVCLGRRSIFLSVGHSLMTSRFLLSEIFCSSETFINISIEQSSLVFNSSVIHSQVLLLRALSYKKPPENINYQI